jgi:predicted ferric reductase
MMVFHALIMLPDPYAKFTLRELLIPFQSHFKPSAMAIGIVTLYSSVVISLSFYAKGLIGQKGWRLVHYLTFALFVGAMAHGLWAGTDTEKGPAQLSYLASGAGVLFLTFFRILAVRSTKPKAVAAQARAKAA